MANRISIKVDTANDGKPIEAQVCPDDTKIYLGKRVDTANDGLPIIAVVGCSSEEIRLGIQTDTANDGKPIIAVEEPCCEGGGTSTVCCPGGGPPVTFDALYEHISGPFDILDGYTRTITYVETIFGNYWNNNSLSSCITDGTNSIITGTLTLNCTDPPFLQCVMIVSFFGNTACTPSLCSTSLVSANGVADFSRAEFCANGLEPFYIDISITITDLACASMNGTSVYRIHLS